MRTWCFGLLIGLSFVASAGAADETGKYIRAGRAAMNSGAPGVARTNFLRALDQTGASTADRFAALIGLGRSDMWLGKYGEARRADEEALAIAGNEQDREVAATELARALNALGYSRTAHDLVEPFARGKPGPTLELLKSQRDLGWLDRGSDYLTALPEPDAQSRLGKDLAELESDVVFARSRRLESGFDYQHDSDDLTVYGFGVGASFPVRVGSKPARYGIAGHVWRVRDPSATDHVTSVDASYGMRIGSDHHMDAGLGVGDADDWRYWQGRFGWEYRPNDSIGASFSVDRAPIFTPTALANRTLVSTYMVGADFRMGDWWYLRPSLYLQDFSDANRRDGGVLRATLSPRDFREGALSVGAEGYARVFHSDSPGAGRGYFNPANFHEERVSVVAYHRAASRWRMRAAAGVGSQTVDGDSSPTYLLEYAIDGRVGENGHVSGSIGRSSASSVSGGGSDYWRNFLGLSIGYPF